MRLLATAAFLAVLATACGSANTSGSSSVSNSSSSSSSAAIQAVQKPSLNGVALSDASGKTLYRFEHDSAGTPTCTGGCASAWPAVPAGASPPAVPAGFSGTFGEVTGGDGTQQLTYNGWPLYTYSADSGSGDATGQGSGGVWFAVVPSTPVNSGAAAATAAPTSAPTSAPAQTSNSSGGGGYYN
jgi:predicted lipoprotein with Yx(FWY)xxD motif